MKTTSVVASLLLSSLAAAAPLNKRAMATKTNVVTETVVVYTTVWDGQGATEAQATPTSTPGLFYEQSSEQPKPTSVYTPPANTPPAVTPSSSSTQEEPKPQPTTSSTSTYVAPQPTTTKAQTPTAAATTTYPAAPAQTTSSGSSSGGSGEVHSGGSITMNYFGGGTGSCGEPIQDSDMAVALASDLFGASTYDPATGNPTNKWCNVKVAITYNGNTQEAVIKDRCEGCTKGGFDMTPALWKAITGGVGGGSGDRLYGATWVALS